MKLLLFDIDGTLLRANGTGRVSIESALSDRFGRSISTDGVTFSGKTDPQIMREVLVHNDVEPTEAHIAEAIAVYTTLADDALRPEHVDLLPGVRPLIERLAALTSVQLGLVTGNVERMAYRKLESVALDAYFPFGAFGSDHADRNCLPPIALERARHHTGRDFAGPDVVVIGDTAHDIQCSSSIGAVAVGVCTGSYGPDDLAPHEPDWLLDDLRDTDTFLQRIVGHVA